VCERVRGPTIYGRLGRLITLPIVLIVLTAILGCIELFEFLMLVGLWEGGLLAEKKL
jgi:hypothetical protein